MTGEKMSLRVPPNYIMESVVALKRAPSGRPYAEWRCECIVSSDGHSRPNSIYLPLTNTNSSAPTGRNSVYPAALLPDGYRAETTENGSKIYTCPVRDCEGTSLSMLHVDVHFMVSGHTYLGKSVLVFFYFYILGHGHAHCGTEEPQWTMFQR